MAINALRLIKENFKLITRYLNYHLIIDTNAHFLNINRIKKEQKKFVFLPILTMTHLLP